MNNNIFIKSDTNKLSPTLIDVEWYEDTCKVLTFGATKYSKDNWKKCEDINRYIDALERHLLEVKKGNYIDSESGCSHLAHISCNAMFLHYFTRESKQGK
ncbi:dATP/dGTP diphosphohydrolase domain-containing protein [Aliarcobacter cibarius]|uniref:dATP/dGTP diphosphohydrolase N-terminal domain-containing protein n=1 Tax=Aliarcobacter cibarius TaxID=255507 RepID=A0ABY2V7E1_9BACT|nr:dATP/dGTP diphosphohydrolase domain-containing protein [Aliarcobacter cibarius]TLS99911.1 hypothetical protein FE247_05110 [Aliarcobacter cibarius]TLT00320.1 hypothetical protein FE245_05540 [Aliarcobacter cibarius]